MAQMFALDRLGVDKEEMHHPVKHIIVGKNKVHLIDFERAHTALKPKNVTQFCQFLTSGHLTHALEGKGIFINKSRILELAKIYKSKQDTANFRKIDDEI